MMTAVILTAVLLVLAAGVYFVASREVKMNNADRMGSQAFSYAEGGIETTLDILNYAGTEWQLTQPRPDQSPDGWGYIMDPDPAKRQNPTNPIQMNIGGSQYTVWVDEVDQSGVECTGCGLNLATLKPAYLLITAQSQSDQGFRELQQRVKLEPSSYPLSLYINGNVTINGSQGPRLNNQSMYVRGDLFGRSKLTITGTDQIYGGPAAAFATGIIYADSNGGTSNIYNPNGSENISAPWQSQYQYDRDKYGPSLAACPYSPPGCPFSVNDLENIFNTGGMLPGGLTTSQLTTLKTQAQMDGYYNDNPPSNLVLQQSDVPQRNGDLAVYVDFPTGSPTSNTVDIKFQWPPPGYGSGDMYLIVRNGSVKLTGSNVGNSQGIIYCPDGTVTTDGSGGGSFTGYLWGAGLNDIGNFNFTLTDQFVQNPPFFAWTVTRESAWTEVDR